MSVAAKTQYAVQLVGPGELKLNKEKAVGEPGPHQMLLKVEATGLCFSDLKILKQFHEHARKSEIIEGLPPEVLSAIPSYVPGDKPTVPGHEVVARIVAVGDQVKHHQAGERVLVQADFRQLLTQGANAAFGYNFEGGLQEYVIVDERVVIDANGERFLIPVADHLGASQAGLVEPWACVEDSYVTVERQTIKAGGKLLVVSDAGAMIKGVKESFAPEGAPAKLLAKVAEPAQLEALKAFGVPVEEVADLGTVPNETIQDIVYFGSDKAILEVLNDKLSKYSILNIVLGGKKIGAPVSVGLGRVHYGPTRWVGTVGSNAADGYKMIPRTGEIRAGDDIVVIGAGGPMGQMHTVRLASIAGKDLKVVASDMDSPRLKALEKKARPFAEKNGVELAFQNVKEQPLDRSFTYYAIMAPVGAIVADAVDKAQPDTIVNIFAGIPNPVRHDLDVDALIEKRVFMFGTSGSTIEDMKMVLEKVTKGSLDTNASVDAVSGMAGAIEGIAAVENRTMAGKIIVYPALHDMGLIPLEKLADHYPTVAAKLTGGQWNKEAEEELLRVAGGSE